MENNILIAYFSATGTTKKRAEQIAQLTGGDLFEIEPVEPYTEEDLDWHSEESRSSIEMKDLTSRPKIKKTVDNIYKYRKLVLGFPIWWYVCPTIINTFIEENDLNNMDIYMFATSGGSSIKNVVEVLKKTYPTLTIKACYRLDDEMQTDLFVKFFNN